MRVMSRLPEHFFTKLPFRLTESIHKGESGRIGVIGGCKTYTGAPYFSAYSALRIGADISHIFCTDDASPVIKTFSPDLIVHPVLDSRNFSNYLSEWLPRLHGVVLGPGLGRYLPHERISDAYSLILDKEIYPLVVDADGIFYIKKYNTQLQKKYHPQLILTPNVNEFKELLKFTNTEATEDVSTDVMALSKKMAHCTIVAKGHKDIIANSTTHLICDWRSSNCRCGGQGDLLSGSIALFAHWCKSLQSREKDDTILTYGVSMCAAYAGCVLTRECNYLAYQRYGRCMTTSDMLNVLPLALGNIFGNTCYEGSLSQSMETSTTDVE